MWAYTFLSYLNSFMQIVHRYLKLASSTLPSYGPLFACWCISWCLIKYLWYVYFDTKCLSQYSHVCSLFLSCFNMWTSLRCLFSYFFPQILQTLSQNLASSDDLLSYRQTSQCACSTWWCLKWSNIFFQHFLHLHFSPANNISSFR